MPDLEPPISIDVAGQQLTLFFNTETQIELMLADIRSATQRVWLETYIFLGDRVGQMIATALQERALAGVDVRVHYDAVGCLVTPRRFFAELETAGVHLHCFHSAWESLQRFAFFKMFNRRNHRKLLVIDDQVAYFGGMNIVDHACETPGESPKRSRMAIGWRDVHVRLQGTLQHEFAASFELSWRRARRDDYQPIEPRLPLRSILNCDEPAETEWLRFFDSGPGPRSDRSARVFTRLLNTARQRVTFSMAYFLPVGRVRRALFRCSKRGVATQIVLPAQTDMPLIQRATRYFYQVLLSRKFEIYERAEWMLHTKLLIVDDEYVVLGSSNFDIRSLWINWEFFALIRSKRLAAVLSEVIAREIQSSRRITRSHWRTQSWWQRWLDRCAWSLRLWL